MIHLLTNPFSQDRKKSEIKASLRDIFNNAETTEHDITKLGSLPDFFSHIPTDDTVVLVGGDGTLSRFVHDVYGYDIQQKLYLYSAGSGNDFVNDVRDIITVDRGLVPLNDFIKHLPYVTVNGETHRFINGIGLGLDGYCCEAGDIQRAKSNKPVNYILIAVKGLLGAYHTVNATVTVDGVTKTYKKVWLAPSMFGRYYGGGMKIAPNQNRCNTEHTLSSVVIFGCNRIKSLFALPAFFKGDQTKNPEIVETRIGHEITVTFDRPTAMQIDGETYSNVTTYTAHYE